MVPIQYLDSCPATRTPVQFGFAPAGSEYLSPEQKLDSYVWELSEHLIIKHENRERHPPALG